MKWPPQLPDINPIELLWDELDQRAKDLRPTSLSGLWNWLNQAWQHNSTTIAKVSRKIAKNMFCCNKSKKRSFQ